MTDLAEYALGLHVGPKVATQVTAILGQRDSGKTYAGMKLAEIIDDFGVPLIVLDPVGVWWSLTVPGSGPALELLVVGGQQGDLPLEVRQAPRLARLVAEKGLSVVVDLSLMREKDQQRFVADFADELFLASRESRTPRTLIVEEAHKFVPQGRPTEAGERIQDIVRIGRNFGLGVVLISQRPQSIDKEVLTQTSLLMVGRLSHNLDVDAVKRWTEDPLAGVKKLTQGTFYSWEPDKDGAVLHRVLPKRTLDASSTPEVGKDFSRKRSSTFNVEEIRTLLALDAPDSKTAGGGAEVSTLRKRVQQLEGELDNRAPTIVTKTVEVPVVPPEHLQTIAAVEQQLSTIQGELARLRPTVSPRPETPAMPDVLLWTYRLGSLSLGEMGVLLGTPCDTREFKRHFSELVVRGSLVFHDGRVRAREPSPPDLPPITGDEAVRLVGRWQPSLSRVQGAMLKYVLMAWPIRPSLDDVAAATGYSVRSGGLRDAPRVLRNLELLDPRCRNRALAPGRVLRTSKPG